LREQPRQAIGARHRLLHRRGFGPWEKTILAALWVVPLVARSVAQVTLIPLGLATFVMLLWRAEHERGLAPAFNSCSSTIADSRGTRGHDIAAFDS
jgi:hypothetical protein